MPTYLGEELVEDLSGTPYEGFGPREWALDFIERFGQFEGAHHKAWVLDQVVRILHGTPVVVKRASWDAGGGVKEIEYRTSTGQPTPAYDEWVEDMKGEPGEDGELEYDYDAGVTP